MRKCGVRIIARSTLANFAARHPAARVSLQRWARLVEEGSWQTSSEIQAAFSKSKVLNGERVRFEVSGGDYRLIAAFKFGNQIAFIKFVGTHAEYDRIDALTVALY